MRIKDLPSSNSYGTADVIAVDSPTSGTVTKWTVQQLFDRIDPTKAATNISCITLNENDYAHISDAQYVRCGRWCQVYFTLTLDIDLAVNTNGSSDISDLLLGTLNNTYRPHIRTAAVPMDGIISMCEIATDGKITFKKFPRGGTAYPTGTTITFGATYLWQN